ncbi:hypothetical protein [Metapseudomonas boanensis]|uniref:Uncharacterized protein n=1 Tax=Metapseudomonas boanensis TaxID=2822138 RepID=A0ABS5XQ38_9GAMM|nr:hypothetical protein [Pseudomonas boanensis]MBT8769433.1 hypothetical protein [Pseudomonas boanensis]
MISFAQVVKHMAGQSRTHNRIAWDEAQQCVVPFVIIGCVLHIGNRIIRYSLQLIQPKGGVWTRI